MSSFNEIWKAERKLGYYILNLNLEENCGTILYDKDNNEIEIPWKPN